MNNSREFQQKQSGKSKHIVLSTVFLFALGIGITPIITGNQLNQAVQNANEAYRLSEQTQYYADNKIPSYDMEKRVRIEGIELYNNINQDKYGKVEWIEAAKDELLITLKDGIPLYEIGVIADKYNMQILRRYQKIRPAFRLRLASVQENTANPLEVISDSMKQQSNGELENIWKELDLDQRLLTVNLNSTLKLTGKEYHGGWWPNDSQMNNPPPGAKGELESIGVHKAWKKLKDSGQDPGGNQEVWIAVIDSGVDLDHPDLRDNIATDSNLISPDNPNGWVGRYFGDPCEEGKYNEPCKGWIEFGGTSGGIKGEEPDDSFYSHGTFVSGIAVETGENFLMGSGVAFSSKIVPMKITFGNIFDVPVIESEIEAINYAASLDKVRIINMSFGGYLPIEIQAVNDAFNAGKILVAGAGNDNTEERTFPAGYYNVIAVSGASMEGSKQRYSNYGYWIDVSAVIDGIQSTQYNNEFGPKISSEDYPEAGGTSWGAPQVAGSIALLISLYPNLSQKDIIDIVLQRPHTFYSNYGGTKLGCGVVNPGDMLISKAPLIVWDDEVVKLIGPQCIRRFWLDRDIKLEWKPFPVGTGPASYRVHYQRYEESGFIPPKSTEGTDIGNITSWTVKSDEAEMLQDGTWVWFLGAWYPGENKLYWTSPQTIFKHTGANISTPKDNKVVGPNEKFDWEDIANANKYVGLLQCDGIPLNPDPRSTKWAWGYLFDMGDKSERFLSDEEWKELKEYANQLPEGRNYMECSWSVAGTRITDQDLWWGLDLNKDAHFKVPRD